MAAHSPTPAAAQARARLDAWSQLHALLMLAASVSAMALGKPWPVGAIAFGSFALLLIQSRVDWATAMRTIVPNAVTAFRLALVVVMNALLHGASGIAWTAAVGVVFALDFIDGWLARRMSGTSAFGAHLDMETDA